MKGLIKRFALLAATITSAALLLSGCSGDDGSNGNNALETKGIASAKTLTADDLRNVALDGVVLTASIQGGKPVVKFQVRNKYTQKGITGLGTFSLHVAQLKPELAGSNSYWMNYIASGLPNSAIPARSSAPSDPTTDSVSTFNADGTVNKQGYSVVDHGDGTYTATFGADITQNTNVPYDASLTHRIVVGVRSVVVPGVVGKTPEAYAGPINPATGAAMAQFLNTNGTALTYDFVPATGRMLTDASGNQAFARDIVTIAACNQCHYRLEYGSNNTSGHFGSRPDTKVCVVCHTPQLTTLHGAGDFTEFIHQIHMGEHLPDNTIEPLDVAVGEVTYPQDVRNCTFCHKGVDVDNWMTKPTRKACGSCHNDVNFATGVGHVTQANDSLCVNCHLAGSVEPVSSNHLPIVAPDPDNSVTLAFANVSSTATNPNLNSNTNASYVAGSSLSRLPVGAKHFKWLINKVYRNTTKNPVMEFKIQVATADSNGVLGSYSDLPLIPFVDTTTTPEMFTGFVGSPSVYFAFAMPQDNATAPVDYNATVSGYLKRIWNGTAVNYGGNAAAATLTGPTSGYYKVTLTGVMIPDNATMLTGGLGYTYGLGTWKKPSSIPTGADPWVAVTSQFRTTTMPLTQTDLAGYPYRAYNSFVGDGGLAVPADNVYKIATSDANTPSTMTTARRKIVDNAKCNGCHGRLGVRPTFHAGQRNDAPTCTFCHNIDRVNSGWSVNIKDDVHAIHAAAKRVNKFSWEATAGINYWEVTYPGTGMLKNCEMCHVAGFYDFSNSVYTASSGALLSQMLYSYIATGASSSSNFSYPSPNSNGRTPKVIITGSESVDSLDTVLSPFVQVNTVYGNGFSGNYNATGGANGSRIYIGDGTSVQLAPQTTIQAANTTLVTSPITAACSACHDTTQAREHMRLNGGSFATARSTALATTETCLICHASVSTTNSTNDTTPNIKAVHRWW